MEYTISKTKRNIIILSSSFLILYVLVIGLFFFYKGPTQLDPTQLVIQNIIYIIFYGYLMLVFVDFFRYYKLKVLGISILTILIMEVISRVIQNTNILDLTEARTILFATNVIWIIATIILVIFLFQTKKEEYPGILSIRKYAIGMIPFFVLGATVPLFVKPDNVFAALQLVVLTLAIPYIFTIDFAMKVSLKE